MRGPLIGGPSHILEKEVKTLPLTDEEYIQMGKKAEEAKEKDQIRSRAHQSAIKLLKASHGPEYDKYYKEALAREEADARRASKD